MRHINFDNTHIYIGSLGKFNFRPLMDCVYMEVIIDFSDGAISTGDIEVIDPDQIILYVAPYKTVAGNAIAAKVWVLQCIEESDVWKVTRKHIDK
ncbi:hypothetical protein JI747_011245 [Chryseobacterium sp. RG1]|uniref:Calcium binding n=1 Tax=Chryseobacterium tagetis TaxID=2801334 RepID=A0ABS8A4W4_9FLAO|nr:hypothetical protein [Chryseobacterium tagetis]MCA6067756.1 hypothetical protein [Chryseobacterium tagetis]